MTPIDVKERDSGTLRLSAVTATPEKILLVANTGWYLFNFRRNLIRQIKQAGFSVAVVCPQDKYAERLVAEESVRWIPWRINRSSMNPFGNVAAVSDLTRIYRRETPDLVHHFTIKAILYGTLAAKRGKVGAIVNSVTGLGHVFLSERLAARVIRPTIRRWYTWALTTDGAQAVFQNRDDLETLAAKSSQLAATALLTRGSGVDLERFAPLDTAPISNGRKVILFAGRLLREKGIHEFVEAAHLCRQRGLQADWIACGSSDPGNPSSVDAETLRDWETDGAVNFVGHVGRMEAQLARADIVVLPSYREGTPRVLLEAAAMGKPAVATDVPGCREVVTHEHNGLLVPPRDAEAIADAVQRLLADDVLRGNMGSAGRVRVKNQFDEREVVAQTIRIYSNMLGQNLNKGVFVISLDFELAWGTRGRPAASRVGPWLDGTRDAVCSLLKLFEQYEVPATWALVGSLLMGRSEHDSRHPWLPESEFTDIPIGDSTTAPRWYAEDMVEWLLEHPSDQEIACHTLTHRFVDPTPAGRERFRQDLQRFRQLFDERYLEQPTSFIYPKAKMAHFDVLIEEGFRCIRGPEDKWFESLPGTLLPAGFRLLDARMAVEPKVRLPNRTEDGLWVLPSSQFYSPLMSVGKRVSVPARVRKAIKGLRQAAAQKRLYHLWTHPFNLGMHTGELLDGFEQILQEAFRLREAGELEILTMRGLTTRLDLQREGKALHTGDNDKEGRSSAYEII